LLIWFFYNGLFMHNYGKYRDKSEYYQYFKYLAYSFGEGRLDLEECPFSTKCHDLVLYNDKIYLYWPPAPALVYMPLVAFYGLKTPDQAVSHILGAVNILLFSLLIAKFSSLFRLNIRFWQIALFTIFYGLGTVHFYISMRGIVWEFAQILGQTFLLASTLIFVSNPSRFKNLFWSGLFFGLMCYTRNNMLFYLFLFAGIAIPFFPKFSRKQVVSRMFVFILPFLIFSMANLWYNYARFGDVFENGLQYHKMAGGYKKNFVKHGYFSTKYFPYNFWIEVLSPPTIIDKFPFFNPQKRYGFGLFWASSVFLLFFPALFYFGKRIKIDLKNKSPGNWLHENKTGIFLIGNLLTLIAVAFVIFCILGPGWQQFGSRYSLDYQLTLILPIVFLSSKMKSTKWYWVLFSVLLILSIYMNYFGAWYFHKLYLKSSEFWIQSMQ
jgi:hypothetical protein